MVNDAKRKVLNQLLELARFIRRRGEPDEAEAVLPYERLLEKDLRGYEAAHAELPGLEQVKKERVAA
jgi:hypothetical protein